MATVYCHKAERVQKMLGIKGSQAAFTDIKFGDSEDIFLFKKVLKVMLASTPNPNNGERIEKPIFSIGRVLVKMSKNTVNYALKECDVYVSNYDFEPTGEKRVQILIAPPATNEKYDSEDIDDFDDIIGTKPSGALADDDDTDDFDDADDDTADDDDAPAPKKKGGKK